MGVDAVVLPDEPQIFDTSEQHKIKVSVLAKGFAHPWALAMLPDGSILVTERAGGVKLVTAGNRTPKPVVGIPDVQVVSLWGLMDVALHPKFAENKLVYISYLKPLGNRRATMAVARGRFDGTQLVDMTDIFVAKAPTTVASSRLAFGLDGSLFVTTTADDSRAQDPGEYRRQDPAAERRWQHPAGQSVVKREGLTAGDLLARSSQPGRDCRAPGDRRALVDRARPPGRRRGQRDSARRQLWMADRELRTRLRRRARRRSTVWQDGFEQPLIVWVPSIAITGIAFYTGDKFPALERQRLRGRPAARPHLAEPDASSASCSTAGEKRSAASRC